MPKDGVARKIRVAVGNGLHFVQEYDVGFGGMKMLTQLIYHRSNASTPRVELQYTSIPSKRVKYCELCVIEWGKGVEQPLRDLVANGAEFGRPC